MSKLILKQIVTLDDIFVDFVNIEESFENFWNICEISKLLLLVSLIYVGFHILGRAGKNTQVVSLVFYIGSPILLSLFQAFYILIEYEYDLGIDVLSAFGIFFLASIMSAIIYLILIHILVILTAVSGLYPGNFSETKDFPFRWVP